MFSHGDVLCYVKKSPRTLSPLPLGSLVRYACWENEYSQTIKVMDLGGEMDGTGSAWHYDVDNFVKVDVSVNSLKSLVAGLRNKGCRVKCEVVEPVEVKIIEEKTRVV